jgi:hypothetical protein
MVHATSYMCLVGNVLTPKGHLGMSGMFSRYTPQQYLRPCFLVEFFIMLCVVILYTLFFQHSYLKVSALYNQQCMSTNYFLTCVHMLELLRIPTTIDLLIHNTQLINSRYLQCPSQGISMTFSK